MSYDLLIKNGTLVDGTGASARHADIAVRAGKIVEIGKASGSAKQTIDAADCVVAPGFIAAYPNAMFRVVRAELPAFVDAVARLNKEADYRALVARYGVERTSAGFWPHSDALAQAFTQLEPVDAGVLDFGRLENR